MLTQYNSSSKYKAEMGRDPASDQVAKRPRRILDKDEQTFDVMVGEKGVYETTITHHRTIRKRTRQCGTDAQLTLTQEADVFKDTMDHFLKDTRGIKLVWKQDLDAKAEARSTDTATMVGTQAKAAIDLNEAEASARQELLDAEARNRGKAPEQKQGIKRNSMGQALAPGSKCL